MTGLSIGVVGSTTEATPAALWALVLREYGRHRVLGYRLNPTHLSDAEAARIWSDSPVAEAPSLGRLVQYCQLIWMFGGSGSASIVRAHAFIRGELHPVVVPGRTHWLDKYATDATGYTPVVLNPTAPTPPGGDTLDSMASPPNLYLASDSRVALDLVEQAWRPIVNTAPVTRARLSEVLSTGLLLPPAASDGRGGISSPLPPQVRTEGQQDATDR